MSMKIIGRPSLTPQGPPPHQPPPERPPVPRRREIVPSGYIYGRMQMMGRYLAIAVLSMILSTGVLMTREATDPRFHITETYTVRQLSARGGTARHEVHPTNEASELWIGVSLITFAAGIVITARFW